MTSQVTLDGYIDTTPETDTGTSVRFDLIHSPDHLDPTDPDAPEQLFACTTEHPAAAELVLHQAKLGDLLRVTGTLTEPDTPGTPPRLRVHSVDILDVAPLTTVSGTVLERYGNYVVVFDADRNEVPRVHHRRPVGRRSRDPREHRTPHPRLREHQPPLNTRPHTATSPPPGCGTDTAPHPAAPHPRTSP